MNDKHEQPQSFPETHQSVVKPGYKGHMITGISSLQPFGGLKQESNEDPRLNELSSMNCESVKEIPNGAFEKNVSCRD